MAPVHNKRERDLFTDLRDKNRIAGRMRRSTGAIRRWTAKMQKKRGKRWQAQYSASVRRHSEIIRISIGQVLERASDLKGRIEEELDVSGAEVKEFAAQYKKEVAELKEAQAALEEARDAVVPAEEAAGKDARVAADVLSGVRRQHQRAAARARREARDVEDVSRELASEASDKVVLEQELRRVVAELESLSG